MSDDEQLDWIAQLDQIMRGLHDFAEMVRGYYQELIDQGFVREEAFALTLGFQQSLMASARG